MFKHRFQVGRRPAPLAAVPGLMACVLAFIGGLAAQAAEEGKASFISDIKAQNARHLNASLDIPEAAKPKGIIREGDEKLSRTRWELSEGPLSLTVTLKKGGPPDALLYMQPVVTLSVDGKQVIQSEGSESFPDNPVFAVQIAEMDPSNPYAEVVFSTYTGGAHCCSDMRVLTSSKDGKTWREIEAGLFDDGFNDGLLEARDLDRDGRYEFAMYDNAFLYSFGSYAGSNAPLQVLQLEDGEIVDASDEPAFRDHHVDSLKDMIEWANEAPERNGFLAGYVGQKIRLGEGADAWKLMLKHYDRKSDWGLDWCKAKRDESGECPKGQTEKLTYPQALERLLREAGYELKK